MPTYEYQCDACGHRFERFQSITAQPLRKCPQCGKSRARRLIGTGAGLIFKGSGFYITDYRSEGYKTAAKAESPATPTKEKSSGDKPAGDTSAGNGQRLAGDSKPSASRSEPAASAPNTTKLPKKPAPAKGS
jgi:putative FmdB family regulatory protein